MHRLFGCFLYISLIAAALPARRSIDRHPLGGQSPHPHDADARKIFIQVYIDALAPVETTSRVEGTDFFLFLLQVWINNHPANRNLKLGLLGE